MGKKSSIITIVGPYYPLETGFSSAFQNFEKAITVQNSIDDVYVIAPHYTENPQINRVIYSKVKKTKFEKIIKGLCFVGFNNKLPLMLYSFSFKEYKRIIDQIVSKAEVKLILVESMFMAWTVPFIIKNYSIPVMVRIHGTGPENTKYLKEPLTKLNEALLNWTFKSKYLSATTSYYFDFFQEYWNDYNHFMNKYFFIIPNTTDIKYSQNEKKDGLVFIQLGRMDNQGYHQKGFTDTIQALLYLEKTLPVEQLKKIKYISIGSGVHEPEFESLLKKLKIIRTEHYSTLPNNEVKNKLIESDVVIMPSRCEGMSMFATEALATGRAFIFTKNNGMKDMILDKYNGLSLSAYDYLEMANAIKTYIFDKNLAFDYGKNSRILFEKEYNYKAVADKFNVVLDTLDATRMDD